MRKILNAGIIAITIILSSLSSFAQNNTELIKKIKESVVKVRQYTSEDILAGHGTGFFVDNDKIITNYHVVDGASRCDIVLPNGDVIDVLGVLAENIESDVVMLKISNSTAKPRTSILLSSTNPEQGDKVIILGNPKEFDFTVSDGIVSAIRTENPSSRQLQFTVPISPGSSGSPIVNLNGEVVGIVTSTYLDGQNINFGTLVEKIKGLTEHEIKSFPDWAIIEDAKLLTTSEGLYIKAQRSYDNADYNGSIYFLEKSITKKPNFGDAWYLMAKSNSKLGNREQAVRCAHRAIASDSNNVLYIFTLGNILSDASRTQEAIIAYKRVIYLKPEYLDVYTKLANCLSSMYRNDEAIETLNKALKINPDFADSYYTMGWIYKGEEDYVHAIESFNKAIKISRDKAASYNALGMCYFEQDNYDLAIESFEKALKDYPNYYSARFNMGKSLYFQRKYAQSIPHFLWCAKTDSTDATVAYYLGLVYRVEGSKELSLKWFATSNSLDPNSYHPIVQLAVSQLETGDYKSALPNLRRAIKLDPQKVDAYVHLSELFIKTEDINQSIEIAREAFQVDPEDYQVLKALSLAYYAKNDFSSAYEFGSKGVDLYPKYPPFHLIVGKCSVRMNNKKQALDSYEKLKELNDQTSSEELFSMIYKK